MEATTLKNIRDIHSRKNTHPPYAHWLKVWEEASKVRKEKKCGLDEALEDVKAGRVYHAESTEDMMKQIFG